MNITFMPISKLKLNDKNPRKIDKDQFEKLCRNIEGDPEYFNMRPCLVNETSEGRIVYAGNQRLRAAKKLGMKEVPCIITNDVPEDLLKKRVVLDNITHGEHDFEMLSSLYDPIELLELGMKEHELHLDAAELIEGEAEEEGEILEPGKDEDAQTKLGDVYELNNHRIVCGDSTLPEYVEKCLNGAEPILMVTDPPYGVNYDASWRTIQDGRNGRNVKSFGKVANDDRSDWSLAYYQFPGSVAYVWHSALYADIVLTSLKDCDFQIIYQIIWVKQSAFGRGDYHWYHEPCWCAVKKGHAHNWQGSRKERTVWDIQSRAALGNTVEMEESTGHSTQKPIECMAKPIRNNTAKGEGVYDPFLGSGTTLIAAEQLSRICYGIELSPAYCDIIVNRWKNYMEKNGREYTIKRNGEIQ